MIRILDSHALMIFFEREPGHDKVEQIFQNAIEKDDVILMTSVNYSEICYLILNACGPEKLNEIENIIQTLPIEIQFVDLQLSREAAKIRFNKKLSFVNSFTAALAKIKRAEIITGDKEFNLIEGEVKISWIA
jgi:ribonuclease VapC